MKKLEDVKIVAVYLRRSRGEEESDLEKHLLTAKQICEQYNWDYTIYQEVESGDSIEARPVMIDLLFDVAEHKYDAVVVTYYDRLGRGSGTDQDIITNTFLNSDTLIIETTPFNVYNVEDDASADVIAFKQFFARHEYKMINKRLNHGRKMATLMGRWVFTVPYGYDYDEETKKLVINENESSVIRKIIEMYLSQEHSTNDIANLLNKEGIPSPKNTKWTATTILYILKSEVYCGHIIHNKSKGNPYSKSAVKKKFQRNPKSEWKKIENTHPIIKTEEEHEKIFEILKKNRTKTGKNNTNVLSGVVKCFNCKKTLTIMKNKDGEDVLGKCYNCGECRGGQVEIVMDGIFTTMDIIKDNLLKIDNSEINQKETENIVKEIDSLNKQLTIQEKALSNIENAFEEGLYTLEKFKFKVQERHAKIEELNIQIKSKTKKLNSISNNSNKDRVKRIENFLKEMKSSTGDKVKQNKLIKEIISRIIWKRTEWDEIDVTVEFKS